MIAKATHVSVSYLTKQFRESGSQSINQYLTEVRLKKAGELLEHSEESITQIAFLVGYKDSNYFSTVFSKTFGVSPKVYREKAKHL
jgi:two-component system response regulator YesN